MPGFSVIEISRTARRNIKLLPTQTLSFPEAGLPLRIRSGAYIAFRNTVCVIPF